eukprot:3162137-Pyramimonas_sp.AAC.1
MHNAQAYDHRYNTIFSDCWGACQSCLERATVMTCALNAAQTSAAINVNMNWGYRRGRLYT